MLPKRKLNYWLIYASLIRQIVTPVAYVAPGKILRNCAAGTRPSYTKPLADRGMHIINQPAPVLLEQAVIYTRPLQPLQVQRLHLHKAPSCLRYFSELAFTLAGGPGSIAFLLGVFP